MKSVVSVLVLAAALAGCGKNPADQAAREHNGSASPASYSTPSRTGSNASSGGDEADARDAPVPKADDGKPIWTANRQRTAEQNAQAAFERNGEAFDAKDVDAFIAKAHDFTNHPPSGVQKISRANGDTELYDAKANVFAVVSKDGAPRTMFKPDNGSAYWDKELAKSSDSATKTERASKKSKNDDEG